MDIIGSIVCIAGFGLAYYNAFKLKKSDKKLNGIIWLILTLVALMCYGAVAAGIIGIIKIPVNALTAGIIYLIGAILLILLNKKNANKQEYQWILYDGIYLAVFFVIVLILTIAYFGIPLDINYYNSDAATHFYKAMKVVMTGEIHDQFFTSFHAATLINICKPVLSQVNYYIPFILFDVFMFFLESVLFVVLIRDFLKSKFEKAAGIVFAVLYFAGYPLNGFLYSFIWNNIAVMLIGVLLYSLRLYCDENFDKKITYGILILVNAALPVTYMMLAPVAYVAEFIMLAIIFKREGRLVSLLNIKRMLLVFLFPTCYAIYYCYIDFMMKREGGIIDVMSIPGGTYADLYINFIWIMPLIVYQIIKIIKNKKVDETFIFMLVFAVVTAVVGVLVFKGIIGSYYYFYKFYPPLVMFLYIMAMQGGVELWKESKTIVISMAIVFACIFAFCVTGLEKKIVASETGLQTEVKADYLFDIYKFNKGLFTWKSHRYNAERREISDYIINNITSEKTIPVILSLNNYYSCYWYEGVTWQDCEGFYAWKEDIGSIMNKIDSNQVDYFVILKDSDVYEDNPGLFDKYAIVFENDEGFVFKAVN